MIRQRGETEYGEINDNSDFSLVTRTVDSRKLYNRKRNARDRYDDSGASAFYNHTGAPGKDPGRSGSCGSQ